MIQDELRRARLLCEVADESLQARLPQRRVPDEGMVAMYMDNISMTADGVFHGI